MVALVAVILVVVAAAVLVVTLALAVLAVLVEVPVTLLGLTALVAAALVVAALQPVALAVVAAALDCLALDRAELPTQQSVVAAAVALAVRLAGTEPLPLLALGVLLAAVLAELKMAVIRGSMEAAAQSGSSGVSAAFAAPPPSRPLTWGHPK